jgi:hypothetical protein
VPAENFLGDGGGKRQNINGGWVTENIFQESLLCSNKFVFNYF